MKKVILYIHEKGGSYLEAQQYKKNCVGFEMVGVDYKGYLPWIAQNQIQIAYDEAGKRYDKFYLIANSIGAYFAMHALQACDIEQALFISPVLDMECLICDMMNLVNVSEKDLREKGKFLYPLGKHCHGNIYALSGKTL